METESPQFIRKHWAFVVAYIFIASLCIGFIFAVMMVLYSFLCATRSPITINAALVIMGVVSVAVSVMQLIFGPLIFTKDVVCRTCHRQQRLNHIPFLTGQRFRQPGCDCGGDLEPALFWKLEF